MTPTERPLSNDEKVLAYALIMVTVLCLICGLAAAAWLFAGFASLPAFVAALVVGAIGALLLGRHIIPQVYADDTDEAGA